MAARWQRLCGHWRDARQGLLVHIIGARSLRHHRRLIGAHRKINRAVSVGAMTMGNDGVPWWWQQCGAKEALTLGVVMRWQNECRGRRGLRIFI